MKTRENKRWRVIGSMLAVAALPAGCSGGGSSDGVGSGNGSALDNRITRNAAANRLAGGAGNDTLEGRGGRDTFIFDSRPGPDSVDVLVHFLAAEDVMELGARVFRALPSGALSADAFAFGTAATNGATERKPVDGQLRGHVIGCGPADHAMPPANESETR